MPFVSDKVVDFLGSGPTYPVQLTEGGSWAIDKGIPLIQSSMLVILGWPIGTRFFLGEFGTRAYNFLEEPNTMVLERLIESTCRDDIYTWETRVEFMGIQITRVSVVKSQTQYRFFWRVINSPSVNSFVAPFYTNIQQ